MILIFVPHSGQKKVECVGSGLLGLSEDGSGLCLLLSGG